jgi:hypothetical protein
MKLSSRITVLAIVTLPLFISACSSVKPWEKQILAQSHMAIEPDPLERAMLEQVVTSKEASSGGYSVAGGGCGCN